MAKQREIKRRMNSVTNTRQITSAMKMVSASKLRRAQSMVGQGTAFRDQLRNILAQVAASASDVYDPLLEVRPVQREGIVVFTSDKGLAGGYNNNVLHKAMEVVRQAEAQGHTIGIVAIGKKATEFFNKRGYTVDESFIGIKDIPDTSSSNIIADTVKTSYINKTYDKVTLVYSLFHSAMSQEPVAVPALPIATESMKQDQDQDALMVDYIFEPDATTILQSLLPLYLSNLFFSAMTDAKAGEHGARMTAMTAATDNATELLQTLEITYNRARQTAITNEITEIVAGADALG